MLMDSRMNKYNSHNPTKRAAEKGVAEIEAHYVKRA